MSDDAVTPNAGDDIAAIEAGAAAIEAGTAAAAATSGRSSRGGARRDAFAGAALLIAVLTVLSRLVGFGRTLVLGNVTAPSINQAYLTANTIPNIIFEIVAGGALASLVVPLVAGAIARLDTAQVGRTASAMLTWVLSLLVPLGVLVAVFARPIVTLAISAHAGRPAITVATGMLRIFAPQIPLYGIAIILGGLLQAHRRFAWPVVAPLFSSLVVIATYLLYGLTEPAGAEIPHVSREGQLILAIGTTLGVAVLGLCMVVPVARLGLRWRPTYRFSGEARDTVAGLAGVAIITVAAQQFALFIAVRLANSGGNQVSLYIFTLAQTVYLVPWSVFALPVAMSVYPALATSASIGDDDGYRRTLAGATRSVLLLSAFGAAALIAAATPLARLFAAVASGTEPTPSTLALAFATFAPGLVGYGLFALHSRALYARAQNRYAALATAIGWGVVIAASYALAASMPAHLRSVALTTANSIGMTVLAVVLGTVVVRRTGRASLRGVPRATLAALIAGAVAAAAGVAVRLPFTDAPGIAGDIGQGMLSGVTAAIVFVAIAAMIDRHDIRPLVLRFTRFTTPARIRRGGGDNEKPDHAQTGEDRPEGE